MKAKAKIFGASLDVLPSFERIALKRAYVRHILNSNEDARVESKDPYDFVKQALQENLPTYEGNWGGKIAIDSWLTPKPEPGDLSALSLANVNRFLANNGCWCYAQRVAHYIENECHSCFPLMIGVDHSLTGGAILALIKKHSDLNVVVLDAHVDAAAIGPCPVADALGGPEYQAAPVSYYECGNFFTHLLRKRVIRPENLWIIGVADEVSLELDRVGTQEEGLVDPNLRAIRKWVDGGVHVISRKDITAEPRLELDLHGPTYLSVDMDVGSLSSVFSARFMNSFGVSFLEFSRLLRDVSGALASNDVFLAGLDIMEIDLHFLETAADGGKTDHTREIVREIFRTFVN